MKTPLGVERVEALGFGSLTLTETNAEAMHAEWRAVEYSDAADAARREIWARYEPLNLSEDRLMEIARAVVLLREAGIPLGVAS